MPWVYIWTSPLKSAYVGTTPVKEIYVGTTKVRPSGWQPWANTVAYRPLNSTTTVNDQSWNNYNLTQTWGSFGTYSGVDCFYNGWSTTGYFNLTSAPLIPSGNASRTISLWTNFSSLWSRYVLSYWSQNGTWRGLNLQTTSSYSFVNIIWKTLRWPNISIGVRYLHTITTEWNEIKYYVNWVLQATNTDTTINTNAITSSLPFRLMRVNNSTSTSYQTRWYLSEVIIENKARTEQEIQDYYNQIKSNYGL